MYRFVTTNPLNGNITDATDELTKAIFWLLIGEKVSVYRECENGYEFFRELSIGGEVYGFDEVFTIGDYGTVWRIRDENAFYVHLPDGGIAAFANEVKYVQAKLAIVAE